MLTRIQKLFAPPVFEDDEDKTRIAGVLNTLLVIMMSFLLFSGVIILPFVFVEKLGNLLLGLGYFFALAVAYGQMQRGRVRLASMILVYGLWLVFTIFLLFAGGMTSIAAVFYVSGTVIAGLLLGTRATLVYAATCILAGLGMVILKVSNRSLPRIFPVPVVVGWVDLILCLLLTTTVLNLVLRGLNDALALARQQVEERKRAEEALRHREQEFKTLVENNPDMVTRFDRTYHHVYANPAVEKELGIPLESLLGKTHRELGIAPETADWSESLVRQVFETGQEVIFDLSMPTPTNVQHYLARGVPEFAEDGAVASALFIHRNVTTLRQAEEGQRKALAEALQATHALRESHRRLEETLVELKETQEQMLHQERLAVVGQLAAGIAHDFNNILASIVLYTQMSLRIVDLSPQIRQRMEIIAQQTDRATDLVQQILDFGRRSVLERQPLAMGSFLKKVVGLLRQTLPESIEIDLTFEFVSSVIRGPNEYLINADITRIQQAIVNLALNARDAMPNGGELCIDLTRTVGQEIQCVDCGTVIGEEWVQVTVTDTGIGIAPDVLPRIFEPFFTTRAPLGHGLGLSQVYGIVKQHRGHIDVQTQVGQGTTFRLYWPVLEMEQPQVLLETQPELAQGTGETILVVEDDTTMRTALVDVLDSLDYRVLSAANGQEALTVCEQHADEIALILSDWVMPSMGGMELVRELEAHCVTTKVLVLTGHPLSKEIRDAVPSNVAGWVLKPPSMEQLAEAVSKALTEDRE
ncbi:MAG: response regulator [Chloroflexi bacterium]|nr:response regulator [Chloroflexota bacterium]